MSSGDTSPSKIALFANFSKLFTALMNGTLCNLFSEVSVPTYVGVDEYF